MIILAKQLFLDTKLFAFSTPFRFCVSTVFAIIYPLHLWTYIHLLDHRDFPSPHNIKLPFLGGPSYWDSQESTISILVMTIFWIGAVKINARNMKNR